MPSINSLTMTCDALNDYGTFSEGDTLTGKVTLALSKEITVESFFVKCKGDADVCWTRKSGDRTHTYSSHRRYFKLKRFLIPESSKGRRVVIYYNPRDGAGSLYCFLADCHFMLLTFSCFPLCLVTQ